MHRQKPSSCAGCQCASHGNDFSAVEGTCSNGVMIIGEASGMHEQRLQLPFRGFAPAGGVLERGFSRMSQTRQAFSITNILRCRPRHDWFSKSPWEYSAARQCRPNLIGEIKNFRPRAIWGLGNIPLRELTGVSGIAEEAQSITHLSGYVLPLVVDLSASPVPVLADFHPAFLRRGKMAYFGRLCRTMQRVLQIAAGKDRHYMWGVDPDQESTWGTPDGEKLKYWLHPTVDQARSFYLYLKDNPQLPFAEDIETPESGSMDEDARDGFQDTHIRQIQFSFGKWTAMALPWQSPFREIAIQIMHLPNVKYGHNWDNFDHKVLRACAAREGWKYAPSRVFDTLDMFHHWQPDLPAHLQYCASFVNFPFPWKHMHTLAHEPFYGCVDVDSDLQLGVFLEKMLKKDGLWGDGESYSLTLGYTGQEREVRPVLAAMEDRGMPVDDARRVTLGAEFDKAQRVLGVEIAGRAPEGCRRVHPKEGYKGVPPQVRALDKEGVIVGGKMRFQDPPTKSKDGTTEEDGEWYSYQRKEFTIVTATAELTTTSESIERWCRVYDFNPNSKEQLISYMKVKKHPVPKSKEEDYAGNQKDTTAAKELQRLAVKTGDDFYLKVIEYRGLTKMRGTYVEGFRPGVDGRVHPTFTFDTGTGQMSSRNPNSTNFPKHKPTPELAKAMRSMVAAPKGYVIAEWDYKSCHALTLGYLAESPRYMRMARLDIHSFVAGHFLNLWNAYEIEKESNDALKARFKWLKSDPERKRFRDDQAKHCILGIGFGLGAKGLYERYMDDFQPRPCKECGASGKIQGMRGLKNCPLCAGSGKQSGQAVAVELLDTVKQLFPEVFTWQKRMQDAAHEKQSLKTEFGHIRRFYEVFRWDGKKGVWGHGDQAEEAIAFTPANIAFGHIREALKALDRSGMNEKWGLFNHIHDSFMLLVPEDRVQEHAEEVAPILLAPSTVLTNPKVAPGGLVIDVEASAGKDWAHMTEINVPRAVPIVTMHQVAGLAGTEVVVHV